MTLAKLKSLAKKVGASVEVDQDGLQCGAYVDLPPGKVIHHAHGNCSSWIRGEKAEKSAALDYLAEWLQTPIEDGCESDDPSQCDHCNPPPE